MNFVVYYHGKKCKERQPPDGRGLKEGTVVKVLLVHDLQAYKQNGVSVSLGILATELRKMGHDMRILTLSEGIHSYKGEDGNYYLSSVPALVYPGTRIRLRRHSRLLKEIIDWNPDVIHTNCEFSTFRIASLIRRRCAKTPVWIHTFHTDYRYYVGVFRKSKFVTGKVVPRFLGGRFSKSDALIVPTQKIYSYVNSDDFSRRFNMAVIPTGIDFSELAWKDSYDRTAARKELGVPEDAGLVIYLGRISVEKNLDELIEYFAAYRNNHDNVYLLTVGDGPYKETLIRHVKKLDIADCVIVHDGVAHSEVRKYYNAADVFASASVSETQGLTFYEAMFCHLPVLARDRKCLEDVVTEGQNGAFFEDAGTFAESLDMLLANKSEDGTQSTLPDCFESEHFAKRVARLYEEMLRRLDGGRR